MILDSLLRNRFIDLPNRYSCQSPISAMAAEELPDMAALAANGQGRETFFAFHVRGELIDEILLARIQKRGFLMERLRNASLTSCKPT
jgi:hypothetical protein